MLQENTKWTEHKTKEEEEEEEGSEAEQLGQRKRSRAEQLL